jgi:hypothetical protein
VRRSLRVSHPHPTHPTPISLSTTLLKMTAESSKETPIPSESTTITTPSSECDSNNNVPASLLSQEEKK